MARQKCHFEGSVKIRKSHCLEKLGIPDERNATVLKVTADIEQHEKTEYGYVCRLPRQNEEAGRIERY